jgi:flagellar biosynthesis protein FlhG
MEKDQVLIFEKNKSPISFFKPQVLSFASGKGGVGRSFIVSSLGITLAKMGLRVVVVDFDFTGANLHSWFGQSPSNPNIGDFFKSPNLHLKDIMNSTNIEELKIIHGFWPTWGIFNINSKFMAQFLEELKSLPADMILVDLGSGLSPFQWEVLNVSSDIILVSTPEPLSIEKNYRWVEKYLVQYFKEKNRDGFSEAELLKYWIGRTDTKHQLFQIRGFFEKEFNKVKSKNNKEMISDKSLIGPIQLILNQTRSYEDENLGASVKSVFNKNYFTNLNYAGFIQYDNAVWQCARQRDPVLLTQPYSPQVGQFLSIAKQLVDPKLLKAVI